MTAFLFDVVLHLDLIFKLTNTIIATNAAGVYLIHIRSDFTEKLIKQQTTSNYKTPMAMPSGFCSYKRITILRNFIFLNDCF
ncbi:MAG: hypothetical protein BGO87_13135 [Flavobacteriia bacterium 40-80]|nr:MAG: hypothetical protein BGO87_13135 [Flavobacteriia bacterium 40-80]